MLRKTIAGLSTMLTVAVLGVGFAAIPAAASVNPITLPDQVCTADVAGTAAWDEQVIDVPEHNVHHDAVTHIVHHDAVTVAGHWWNWSPNKDQGPFDGPPSFPTDPRGTWEGDHAVGGPIPDAEGTYQTGEAGNADWFHRGPRIVTEPASDEVVVDEEAWDETIPATYKTVHHDAVAAVPGVCDVWVTWATDTWAPDANDANDVAWPQHFVSFGQVSPTECETTYQQDRYVGSRAAIEAVIGDGTLAGLPPEDSGIVTEWAFVSTDTCGTEEPPCEAVDTPVWHVWTGGPIESDEGPAADADGWNANSGMPQSANHLFSNHEAGVPYFVSHGNSGNGDWFLWTLEDCPDNPTLLPASVSWNGVDVCADPDGSGDLTVVGAHLVAATWNDQDYTEIGDLSDFHDGHYDATSEGHFVLTYEADDGYTFGDSSGVLDFTVTHATDCGPQAVGIPFSVTPTQATCAAPGSFDAAALGGVYNEESGRWEFENVNVEVIFDGDEVTLNVFAHEGYVIDPALLDPEAGWFVEEGGARASLTITLEPQNTDVVACPQDVDEEEPVVDVSNELDAPPAQAVEAEAQFAG